MHNEASLLQARVIVLTVLVRALFRQTFLSDGKPVEAFDAWAKAFSGNLETEMRRDKTPEAEAAWIMVSEPLNEFLDQLRHELQEAQNRERGSRR